MAQVLLIGGTGTGKSTSLSTLNPEETFIIRVVNKALPFKGWKGLYKECTPGDIASGNMYTTYSFDTVVKIIDLIDKKRPNIRNLVIDDFQFLMSFEYMQNATQKGFQLFKDLALDMFKVTKRLEALRDDLNVVLTWHPEIELDINGNKYQKAKTVGKMFDQQVTIEGMFTYVLFTELVETNGVLNYQFRTQNSGSNTGKSPKGCFADLYIPNDMQLVFDTINKFEHG